MGSTAGPLLLLPQRRDANLCPSHKPFWPEFLRCPQATRQGPALHGIRRVSTHMHTHTHAQRHTQDVQLHHANLPFPLACGSARSPNTQSQRGQSTRHKDPESASIFPTPACFPAAPLSLPLRRPYLQGECKSPDRRKPFGFRAWGTILPLRASWYLGLIPLWKHGVEGLGEVRGLSGVSVYI